MGARPRRAHALPDGGADGAGHRRLFPARAGRRPALHLPCHGGAHLLARRHGAAGGRAGDRQDRAHAAGGALRRQNPQLLQAGGVADHFPDQGFFAPQRGGQRLVPGAQACGRHALHAAAGHPGAVLQRRLWRCLRRDLRAGGRRLQLRRGQGVCRRRAPAAAACARRGQGGTVRRAGREAVHRDFAKAPGPARPGHEPGAGPAGPAERGGECRYGADAARPGAGARGWAVRRAGGFARHADTRRLGGTAAPGRYRHRHARVRRPGHGEGAPPGARSGGAGGVDGQGGRHHPLGQGPG